MGRRTPHRPSTPSELIGDRSIQRFLEGPSIATALTCHHREFVHITRMRDGRFPHELATLLPGELFVSKSPMIVYTVLGSCIAVCMRDPIAGVGGMNHFMLPSPAERGGKRGLESARYGCYAMEQLIGELLTRGGARQRLEVKLFGGGRMYEGNVDIGASNAEWILAYLSKEGFQITTTDVGDIYPRKVYYFTESGRALVVKMSGGTSRCGRESPLISSGSKRVYPARRDDAVLEEEE